MRVGVLRLAPWRRGPALLLRRPGVVVALAAAAFVATLPAAAAPLFLSSAQDATLHHQLAAACPWTTGAQVRATIFFGPLPEVKPGTVPQREELRVAAPALIATRQRAFAAATAGANGLSAPVSTVLMPGLDIAPPSGAPATVTLMGRTGFHEHITVLSSTGKPGIWLPDTVATASGLRAGDTVGVGQAQGRQLRLPVAGTFTDLRAGGDEKFWCSLTRQINGDPGQEFTNRPLFPVALADEETFVSLGDTLGGVPGDQWTEYAVADPRRITTGDAERLVAGVRTTEQRLRGGYRSYFRWEGHQDVFSSRLPGVVRRAELVRSGLLPPVIPITAAGSLVGLLVVAAAAVFWVQRRARELRVLAVHGVGAPALGTKAVAEALPALAVGALAGLGCAWLLVDVMGPDAQLSTTAVPQSIAATVAALIAATAVCGVVAALRCRGLADQVRPHRRLRAAHLPWELALLGAGAAGWRLLSGDAQLVDDPVQGVGAVAHVPARLLVVPILLIAGLVAFAARLTVAWLRRRALNRTPRRPAALLAWRRLSREGAVAAVLAAATAIPIALAAYGAAVTGSVRDTAAAEARVTVGSDLVATLAAPAPIPATLAGRATPVVRANGVTVGGVKCDVLMVDPATFARGAYWDDRVDGPTLTEMAAGLTGSTAVGAGVIRPGGADLTWGDRPLASVTVRHVALLPGAQGGYPVLLLDRAAADPKLLAEGVPQIWVRGAPGPARAALATAHTPVRRYAVADDLFAGTLFEPVTYTFGYLIALSLLTGLVTLVGLLLYLESRTPSHRRGYVVLRRMGLRAPSHRRALIAELATPLAAGLGFGLACGYALTRLLEADFDLNRAAPPTTLVSLPVTAAAWIAGAVAAVAVGAALLAHRRVGRANPSEVLRDTV